MPSNGFNGLRVLALESRRQREMAQLISNNGGEPMVVASTRDVPIEHNPEINQFVSALLAGKFQVVIFLTGVGARALVQAAEAVCPREKFIDALKKTTIIARGPKPVAALREFGVPVTLTAPEPNTWREVLQVLDDNKVRVPLQGKYVAVQEHGAPSPELMAGLAERGAQASSVRVYEWAQPEDKGPLREAVLALTSNEINVVLFTSQVQLTHLLEIAEEQNLRKETVQALNRAVVASIGPVTSQALREQGVRADMEPSHPKMGFLVKEAAEQSAALRERKKT